MVKLRRVALEDDGITGMPSDSSFPQRAIIYYGMKAEANKKEFQFFFTVYDKKRTPESIVENGERADYVFQTTSRHSLETEMQNSSFLSDKDFGAINKYRNDDTHTLIGYIIEPLYRSGKNAWDYASVYLDNKNNIILEWRH